MNAKKRFFSSLSNLLPIFHRFMFLRLVSPFLTFLLRLYNETAFCHFFFFQAEDGIRDADVTGVQTCALPISWPSPPWLAKVEKAKAKLIADTDPLTGLANRRAFLRALGRRCAATAKGGGGFALAIDRKSVV